MHVSKGHADAQSQSKPQGAGLHLALQNFMGRHLLYTPTLQPNFKNEI